MKTLTDYGMNFDVNYYENEQGTRITVILHLSPLMAFDSTINSMQEYESGNPHGNYEFTFFQKIIKDVKDLMRLSVYTGIRILCKTVEQV